MTREQEIATLEREIEAELLRRSFAEYLTATWPLLTGVPLRTNVAIGGLVAVLQAIADRRIRRARIEVGPGLGKSTTLVAYSTWRLARRANHRAIHGSHAHDLAARDSRKARRLVESEWWRARFAARLSDDENTASHWRTTSDGRYLAVGVGGSLTGHRAHEVVIDDGLNAVDAHSKAARDACYTWLTEGLVSRLDLDLDGGDGSIAVVGQRLHVDDLHGRLDEHDAEGWRVLRLPAEYDTARPCVLYADDGTELWRDPRTTDGELAAPDVLSREKLDGLRRAMGSAAYQAQLNQRPSDDSAAMFPRAWLNRRWTELPRRFDREVIALDSSFRESKSADYAVLQCWGALGGDRYLVEQWRRQAGFVDTLAALRDMAKRHPYAKILVEARANGDAIIDAIRRELPGVVPIEPDGGKVARAASVQAIAESGAILLPANAPWVEAFVDEVSSFPASKNDDQTDAMVYGLRGLQQDDDDPVATLKAANAGLDRLFGLAPREPDPVATTTDDADRQRRRERLDALAARALAGEQLTRREIRTLKMFRPHALKTKDPT